MGLLDGMFRRRRARRGAGGDPEGPVETVGDEPDAFGDSPIASADEPERRRGLQLFRRRRRAAAAGVPIDPNLPDPAEDPGFDCTLDAKGRLRAGRRRLAVALQWQPRQTERSLNAQARDSTFEGAPVPGLAALFADGMQVGFGSRAEGMRAGMAAAATAIPMRLTGDTWLGAFRLENEGDEGGVTWWLVALREGMVYEDRLIPMTQEAQEAFVELLEVPGWKARICPAGWDLPDTTDIPLPLLLPRRTRGAVLRVHDPKVIWAPRVAFVLLLGAIGGGALYYQSYMEEQRRLEELARRQAAEAARRAALNVAPWVNTPSLRTFIAACGAEMEELLVLPPGWRISNLGCTPGDGAVTVAAEWRRDTGGRASWFLATMDEFGLGDAQLAPTLETASLSRTAAVPVLERRGEQPLPPTEMERNLRLRLDTLSLDAQLRPGTARAAPPAGAPPPGGTNWTNHEFEVTTGVIPFAYADLLADIPGVVARELTYDPYAPSWRLTALIYHPPAISPQRP